MSVVSSTRTVVQQCGSVPVSSMLTDPPSAHCVQLLRQICIRFPDSASVFSMLLFRRVALSSVFSMLLLRRVALSSVFSMLLFRRVALSSVFSMLLFSRLALSLVSSTWTVFQLSGFILRLLYMDCCPAVWLYPSSPLHGLLPSRQALSSVSFTWTVIEPSGFVLRLLYMDRCPAVWLYLPRGPSGPTHPQPHCPAPARRCRRRPDDGTGSG